MCVCVCVIETVEVEQLKILVGRKLAGVSAQSALRAPQQREFT